MLLELIKTLLQPSCWVRLGNTNPHWDEFLNATLDSDPVFELSHTGYTIKLNGISIWVGNYPYAYGNVNTVAVEKSLPSRATVRRLNKFVTQKCIENYVRDSN